MNAMKLAWHGKIIGVQPRIRLTRSFDQHQHSYLGYMLLMDGQIDAHSGVFIVGIGAGTQSKHQFQSGDTVSGECEPVNDKRIEPADYYKASRLVLHSKGLPPLHPGRTFRSICKHTVKEVTAD